MASNAKRAPSLWLQYDYKEPGDILMQDVFVPASGLAKCTYYCCLNWNTGQEGGGYCGLQDHPDGRAFIFSIWDPQHMKDTPITAVAKGQGTWTDRFGGEGTGLKSMNFELGWKENQWYTMVVRRWDSPGGATRFGCWVYDHNTGSWTHLITMEYPVPHVYFTGVTVSFLEDWGFTSENYRCVNYKGGFKRKLDKSWVPFRDVKFQVNMHDIEDGTATMNFDAQCSDPEEGVCIAAGADIKGNTGTCCTFSSQAFDQHHRKQPIQLQRVELGEKSLTWVVEDSGAPQLGYKVTVADEELCWGAGEHVRGVFLDQDVMRKGRQSCSLLVVELEDILGNCVSKSFALQGGA